VRNNKLVILFIFIALSMGCSKPVPGDIRARKIEDRCLKSRSAVGVGPNMIGKGGAAVTVSSVCTNSQEVWITEKYEFEEWIIQAVELRNL